MKALKQRLLDILAQAKGTRWDVVASQTVGVIGALAGIAPWAHLIPGKTGAAIAGASAVAAAILPRATKAAGLLATAYGQKTPLLKVVPQLLSTLFSGPAIIAQAKAAEAQQIADQVAQKQQSDYAKLMNDAIDEIERRLKTGSFTAGELSQDVPEMLKDAFQTLEKQPDPAASTPTLSSTITVADKAPSEA